MRLTDKIKKWQVAQEKDLSGNRLCQAVGRADYLAALLLEDIEPLWKPNTFIFIHSFKREAELQLFQKIFGTQFFSIGVSQNYQHRETYLRKKLSYNPAVSLKDYIKHHEAVDSSTPYAVHVQKIFPKVDIFLDLDNPQAMQDVLDRFFKALFDHPFVFPSNDEAAMAHAYTQKLRSADTSRPVGAVLMDEDDQLLVAAYNEVPKSGGGVYTGNEPLDGRDWAMNLNTSFQAKKELFYEVLQFLEKNCAVDLSHAYDNDFILQLKYKTRFMDILEYSRNVHAEMNVITQAARRGLSTHHTRLYTTTFPCHTCAKHIIAAGIKEVIYNDPFNKSRAAQLFQDSLTIGETPVPFKVYFRPYTGISAEKYSIFKAPPRENDLGEKLAWTPSFKLPLQDPSFIVEKIQTYKASLSS